MRAIPLSVTERAREARRVAGVLLESRHAVGPVCHASSLWSPVGSKYVLEGVRDSAFQPFACQETTLRTL